MLRSLIAAALLCALPSIAHARGLDPACNVTIPCEKSALINYSKQLLARNLPKHASKYAHGYARTIARPSSGSPTASYSLVSRARAYLGQTARQVGVRTTLWCSAFLRHLTGASGVDDRAISWLRKPHVGPVVGSIAVMRHHVGIVSSFDQNGNPIIVSGNHRHRVGEGVYSARRVLAYVSI